MLNWIQIRLVFNGTGPSDSGLYGHLATFPTISQKKLLLLTKLIIISGSNLIHTSMVCVRVHVCVFIHHSPHSSLLDKYNEHKEIFTFILVIVSSFSVKIVWIDTWCHFSIIWHLSTQSQEILWWCHCCSCSFPPAMLTFFDSST